MNTNDDLLAQVDELANDLDITISDEVLTTYSLPDLIAGMTAQKQQNEELESRVLAENTAEAERLAKGGG
jgi:hypothetical protein